MNTWQRRTAYYLLTLVAVVALFTLLYHHGMVVYEGRPTTFLHSLQVVVETFTTTGFGSDAPWDSPQMNVLVILMDITGVALIFLTLPLFIFPLFEETLSTSVPNSVDHSEHVVVCGFSSRDETLIDELDSREIDTVVLVPDEDDALDLQSRGITTIAGDPESTDALERAGVPDARAVVIDGGDEANAVVALSVRELAPDVRIASFVEHPSHREYIQLAGADEVLSPREILGHTLAQSVTNSVKAELGETVEIGEDFEIVELPVLSDSELAGVTLGESAIRERTGANVIGAWFSGEFVPNPPPERRLDRSTVLLVSGSESQLEALTELARSEHRRHRRERIIIAGHGEVGSTVKADVESAGLSATVLDIEDGEAIDVVGDATEASTLEAAGIGSASALIVALSEDTQTVFSTLVARELDDEIEIVCRANLTESVRKLYGAGADYVLGFATVSGRMLVSAVLDEEVMSLGTQIEIVRVQAPAFVGNTVQGADVRNRTGCTIIAVERDGSVLTQIGPSFEIEDGDALVVAGTAENVSRFTGLAEVPAAPP